MRVLITGGAGFIGSHLCDKFSILELAAIVSQITGDATVPEFAAPRTGELQRSALSSKRAERDLGWHPATPLAEGVADVVSWIAAGAPDRALT